MPETITHSRIAFHEETDPGPLLLDYQGRLARNILSKLKCRRSRTFAFRPYRATINLFGLRGGRTPRCARNGNGAVHSTACVLMPAPISSSMPCFFLGISSSKFSAFEPIPQHSGCSRSTPPLNPQATFNAFDFGLSEWMGSLPFSPETHVGGARSSFVTKPRKIKM